MAEYFNNTNTQTGSVAKFALRLVAAMVVLSITAFLTPGFTIDGLFPLFLSALVISVLDFALSKLGLDATPFGRGITGFILAAAVIYMAQFFITGYTVTLMGAVIAALVYGIIDAFIPGKSL